MLRAMKDVLRLVGYPHVRQVPGATQAPLAPGKTHINEPCNASKNYPGRTKLPNQNQTDILMLRTVVSISITIHLENIQKFDDLPTLLPDLNFIFPFNNIYIYIYIYLFIYIYISSIDSIDLLESNFYSNKISYFLMVFLWPVHHENTKSFSHVLRYIYIYIIYIRYMINEMYKVSKS